CVSVVHSDPESFDPLRQLPDVEIDQETNRFLRVYLSDLRAPEGSLCGSMIFMSSLIISEVWCHDPVLPSGKASAEQLTAKVYHLAGCATMADPTRTSGSFSPVSCRCLLSSWLRPHWGISQENYRWIRGSSSSSIISPDAARRCWGADRTAGGPNPPKRRLSDDQERSRLYPEFEFLRLIFINIIPRLSD